MYNKQECLLLCVGKKIPGSVSTEYRGTALWDVMLDVPHRTSVYSDFLAEIKADFNIHGSVHRKNILIYIQQDVTLHSLFYLETALHVSGGTTTHHQERKLLYLQHLVFVTPLLLSATIVEELEPV
jgi:hypothetical protein